MIKQIKSLLAIMIMLIALPTMAYSVTIEGENSVTIEDEDSTIEVENEETVSIETEDNITEEDSNMISDNLGAKIRLLQLQKRVELQMESANLIIESIYEMNPQANTTELEEINAKFEKLLMEIEGASMEEDQEVLAQNYVAMKKQAIELTQEFRIAVKDDLNDEQKEQIKKRLEIRKEIIENRKDARLEQLKNEFNAKKAMEIMARLNVENEELANQLKTGELTVEEVRAQLKERFQNMSAEEKREAALKIKEENQKRKIEMQEERQALIEKAKEKRAELKERLELRKQEIERIKERQEEMKSRIMERIGDRNSEIIERIENNPQIKNQIKEQLENNQQMREQLNEKLKDPKFREEIKNRIGNGNIPENIKIDADGNIEVSENNTVSME